MLIKIIRCTTSETKKQLFSEAQTRWRKISDVKGFVAQFGGWNQNNPLEAVILGCWEDEAAYRRFMRDAHDEIYQYTSQTGTFDAIQVALTVCVREDLVHDLIENLSCASQPCLIIRQCNRLEEQGGESSNLLILNDPESSKPRFAISLVFQEPEESEQITVEWIDLEPDWQVMTK